MRGWLRLERAVYPAVTKNLMRQFLGRQLNDKHGGMVEWGNAARENARISDCDQRPWEASSEASRTVAEGVFWSFDGHVWLFR
jgi:hypothetical protein